MEENKNKQHVQVPHLTENDDKITPKDLLIYACIRRHMNNDTLEAYPALSTIAKESGASQPTVSKCINILKEYNYFTVTKKPNPYNGKLTNFYKINVNKCPNFEMFSYEFLDKNDLSFNEKAYILAAQQFMIKNNDEGRISFTNEELGDKIHVSERSIIRYNQSLSNKSTPYLKVINEAYNKDIDGNCRQIKIFDLPALGQALVCTAIDHEIRISENEEKLNQHSEDIALLKEQVAKLMKENAKLVSDNQEQRKMITMYKREANKVKQSVETETPAFSID